MTRPPAAQPRLARVAAAIGEPARAAMLARLLDGRYHTAGELAACAQVAASTASQHLRLLLDERLVRPRTQGRHRYFMLADGDVAHALEALLRVADAAAAPQALHWQRPAMRGLRHARTCYGHLAGELGVRLHDALLRRGWVRASDADAARYALVDAGRTGFASMGLALEPQACRHALYDCVDWSERRDHFAGPVAVALLDGFVERGWLRRQADTRELAVTPTGRVELLDALGAA